jgi:hypothetical protein
MWTRVHLGLRVRDNCRNPEGGLRLPYCYYLSVSCLYSTAKSCVNSEYFPPLSLLSKTYYLMVTMSTIIIDYNMQPGFGSLSGSWSKLRQRASVEFYTLIKVRSSAWKNHKDLRSYNTHHYFSLAEHFNEGVRKLRKNTPGASTCLLSRWTQFPPAYYYGKSGVV